MSVPLQYLLLMMLTEHIEPPYSLFRIVHDALKRFGESCGKIVGVLNRNSLCTMPQFYFDMSARNPALYINIILGSESVQAVIVNKLTVPRSATNRVCS